MTKDTLKELSQKLGIETGKDDHPGPGRKPGSKGPLPAIKAMTSKQKDREIGTSRKRIKDLEQENQDLRGKIEPDAMPIPPELWGAFPSMLHDYLADRFGDHWKLTEPEVKLYGENLNRVANRYLPEMTGKHPELVGLAMVAVTTTVPRGYITIKLRVQEKHESTKDKRSDNGPGSTGDREDNLGQKSTS